MCPGLPHTVLWRAASEEGREWEGSGYKDAVEIPARKERRTRMRQTATGDERVNETRIMVGPEHAVTENDTLDGERVEATDEQVDMDGSIVGRIAYLEA